MKNIKYLTIFVIALMCMSFVDPTLTNITLTPKIDGSVEVDSLFVGRNDTREQINTAVYDRSLLDANNFRGYLSFNTSTVLLANITHLYIQLNWTAFEGWSASRYIMFRRLNLTNINATFPNSLNLTLSIAFGDDYANITNITTAGIRTVSLGSAAIQDLKDQLSDEYFSLGTSNENGDDSGYAANFSSMEGNYLPRLIIEYESDCLPPVSGDWTINITCNIAGQALSIPADVTIQDKGYLNVSNSRLNFTSTNQYIRVYKGGRIQFNQNSSITEK